MMFLLQCIALQLGPSFSGDAAVKEVSEIRNAYSPQHPNYKFQYLFLNVIDNPQQKQKPANVDEMRWRQAMAQAGGPDNPDRYALAATSRDDFEFHTFSVSFTLQLNFCVL